MPPDILAFKLRQEAALRLMPAVGSWPRLTHHARQWATPAMARTILAAQPAVVARDGFAAVRDAVEHKHVDGAQLADAAEQVLAGRIAPLGADLPEGGLLPWHQDWRFGHTWEPAYFKSYNFYQPRRREEPYDIKFPWELSRLHFLLPALHADVVAGGHRGRSFALRVLADWDRHNPLAFSANWQAMEASMRTVNLVHVLGVLAQLPEASASEQMGQLLIRMLAEHGEFIWRTRELSDIRGNHYAANVAALTLLGVALRGHYPPAARWLEFGAGALPGEVTGQFLPDGVNFEMSLAYHRLVTSLFLLAGCALERVRFTVTDAAWDRLHAASRYSAQATRPDGLHPQVGDSDDASVLHWNGGRFTSPAALNGLAAVKFDDPGLVTDVQMPVEVPWLLGRARAQAWPGLASGAGPAHVARHFAAGGVVVVRHEDSYLWMDVGEVGLQGRGGHGHNDITSFELWLQGQQLLVDPGSYCYTADAEARDTFRSTAYHNAIRVDGEEMAPMGTMWRLGDDAVPRHVEVQLDEEMQPRIQAGHAGYERLPDPVQYRRRVLVSFADQRLQIDDEFSCAAGHQVERSFHFAPGLDVSVTPAGHVLITGPDGSYVMRPDSAESATVVTTWRSPMYGVRVPAASATLTSRIDGSAQLRVALEPGEA